MEQTTSSPTNRVVLNLLLYLSIVLMCIAIYGILRYVTETTIPQSVAPKPVQPTWWMPSPGVSWQWQLSNTLDTSLNVQMYLVDLYDAPQDSINQLRGYGRKVICYFSAGTLENWRPDKDAFPAEIIGGPVARHPFQRWLNIHQLGQLKQLMSSRLDLAAAKGCDGILPDNVDGYINETGFPLTYTNQLTYNIWLAEQAHEKGLSVGLKDDLEQVKDLLPHFDWALGEECFTNQTCDQLSPFIDAGKAVFGVEYSLNPLDFCPQANEADFDFLLKRVELDSWREACR